MVLSQVLLDVSWSVQYVPEDGPIALEVYNLLESAHGEDLAQSLANLSADCFDYIQSRSRAEPKDDLNDGSDRTGLLRECVLSKFQSSVGAASNWPLGLLIETRYQRITYQIVLLARQRLDRTHCPIATILHKASPSNLKYIKTWLFEKFSLPVSIPMDFLPEMLANTCSTYLTQLNSTPTGQRDESDALRLAMMKQAIGNLKLTIVIGKHDIASMLRTIDLDLPVETIFTLLKEPATSPTDRHSAERTFLDALSLTIAERTGLKLPLSGTNPDVRTTQATTKPAAMDDRGADAGQTEPPMKIAKISCAGFALSTDGRIKMASKPMEGAETVGYSQETVSTASLSLLRMVGSEAERRASGNTV